MSALSLRPTGVIGMAHGQPNMVRQKGREQHTAWAAMSALSLRHAQSEQKQSEVEWKG